MDRDRELGEVEGEVERPRVFDSPRFTTRPATLREMIWVKELAKSTDNIDALGKLLESRRIDPTWNVLDLAGEDLIEAISEMTQALNQSTIVDALLKTLK